MKEAASTYHSKPPLPQPTIARKQERRKYYIMRRRPFQAISEPQRKDKMYMGRILDAFANDELTVNPAIYKGSSEYRKAVHTLYKTSEILETKLNEEEKKLFEQFCNARDDEDHLYQLDVFNRGFRIAVLMLFEVFAAGKDEFILGKGDE